MINGEMVTLARDYRGLTQAELALRLHVSQSTVAKIEAGLRNASEADRLDDIAAALDFPPAFFLSDERLVGYGSSAYFYHKRATILASDRKRIHSIVNLNRIGLRQLLRHVDIDPSRPLRRFDVHEYGSAERVAHAVRGHWSLPDGPVANITKLIEGAGIIVVPCDFETDRFDATSLWLADLPPMIFINSSLPGDRWRFTLAHELAHLVMHDSPREKMEDEADAFAAEFLAPEDQIKPHLLLAQSWKVSELIQLKLYWRVSIGMLVRRAYELGLMDDSTRQRFYIRNAAIRRHEPEPLDQERAESLEKIVEAVRDGLGFGFDGLARLLRLPNDVTASLSPSAAKSTRLRLVPS